MVASGGGVVYSPVSHSLSQQQATSEQQAYSEQGSSGTQQAASTGQSTGQSLSSTYIPEYSQTPILRNIALQAQGMAAPAYQWGIDQYNKNQGNIDQSMRNAQSYASPQRTQAEMGMAEAKVQQGAEAGRQSSIRDLQGYGIDPSSGRYADLDKANRITSGATTAGAGNQQRMATEAAGTAMQNSAMSQSLQNNQLGYGAANSANALLGTASQLKYDPLGTASSSAQQATNDSFSSGDNSSYGMSESSGDSQSTGSSAATGAPEHATTTEQWGNTGSGGEVPFHAVKLFAAGGGVPDEVSPSHGGKVDDVPANLNAGEFIIPKDVAAWKGQEFFYKLMAEARKMRAMAGQSQGQGQGSRPAIGYGAA